MKALFLIFHGFEEANGISKKIRYQVKALKECGMDVHTCYLNEENGHKCRMIDNHTLRDYGSGIKGKLRKRFELQSIVKYILQENIRLVYMRSYHNANPFTISMVKQLKRQGVKVVMEIPTYPYDQEYITRRMKLDLLVDRCFRRKLAAQLDGIVTFSDAETIFGGHTHLKRNRLRCHTAKDNPERHFPRTAPDRCGRGTLLARLRPDYKRNGRLLRHPPLL